jgi:hypothetical protein
MLPHSKNCLKFTPPKCKKSQSTFLKEIEKSFEFIFSFSGANPSKSLTNII